MKQKTSSQQKNLKSASPRQKRTRSKKPTALSPEVLPKDSELDETENEATEDEPAEVEMEDPSEADLASSDSSPQLTPSLDTETSAISPNDPLKRYLEEIKRYPLLDTTEEFALAVKLKEQGDMQAARSLVSANLRLVVKIAFEYRTFYSNLLDLIQEGNIGLMKAVSKFDPTKGARLGYYASWWIRSYILKYLLDNFRLVKVGTTQAQKKLFYHLMREKERLEAQGLLAGPKLLAEKLNVREKDVVEMEQRLSGRGSEMSLDAPIDRGEGKPTTQGDLLVDHQEAADDALARDQLIQLLKSQLPDFEKKLNEKERRILQDRLLADEPKTLQEVADLYGLTRERARQIETRVIEKLREFLSSMMD